MYKCINVHQPPNISTLDTRLTLIQVSLYVNIYLAYSFLYTLEMLISTYR